MWEVHYSREAATYLEDNGQLIAELFFAMESLADSAGIPKNGDFHELDDRIYWSILAHWVVYRRIDTSQIIRIILIKPQ